MRDKLMDSHNLIRYLKCNVPRVREGVRGRGRGGARRQGVGADKAKAHTLIEALDHTLHYPQHPQRGMHVVRVWAVDNSMWSVHGIDSSIGASI